MGGEVELPETKLPKTKKSNILIWFFKLGLIVIIIAGAVYFIHSSLSDNNQELNCGDPNQDGSNITYVCPSGKTLKLPPNDNLCTGDTCTDTDCCVDIPSVDSSSGRVCQRPSTSVLNNYNMTNVQENNLHMDSFDVTGITCNTGYSGTAVATACTRPGGHYNVSGCTSSTPVPITSSADSIVNEWCPDFNGDNFVNNPDLLELLAGYQNECVDAHSHLCLPHKGEGQTVGASELLHLLSNYGSLCNNNNDCTTLQNNIDDIPHLAGRTDFNADFSNCNTNSCNATITCANNNIIHLNCINGKWTNQGNIDLIHSIYDC